MLTDWYSESIGKIIANLHGLEFMLRCYLYIEADEPHDPFPDGKFLDDYKVGDVVPLNAFSCYDSLGKLIDRYNKRISPQYQVDMGVVDLRDAFAHGRISSDDLRDNSMLVKTSKDHTTGQVRVSYLQELSPEWLTQQARYVTSQVKKVMSTPGMRDKSEFISFSQ